MADGSQEKSLPATPHHLKKARERGQVASSSQFVSAAVASAGMLWIAGQFRAMGAEIARFFSASFERATVAGPGEMATATQQLLWTALGWIAPVIFLSALAGIAANIAHKGGLIVSFKPIAPDFSRISPADGFGKLFSRRNFLQLVVGVVGLLLFIAVAATIIVFLFPPLLNSPLCGAACSAGVQTNAFLWLLAAGFVAFAIAAAVDLPLQQRLFAMDMRMTPQEMKQESKEMEGSPEVKRHRRQTHLSLIRASANAPTLVLARGGEAVSLRYHPTEAPVPVILAKGRNALAERMLRQARASQTPIFFDPPLVRRLMSAGRVGNGIPREEFRAIAPYIVKSRRAD